MCGRVDLMEKPNFDAKNAYQNYRICERHFQRTMFNNPQDPDSRLLPSAEPIPFEDTDVTLIGT